MTQTQDFKKLAEKQLKEIKALKLQHEATEKTGLKCIGYSHCKGLGFMAYTPYVYENGIKTLSDVKKVLDVYIPSENPYVLTFSGRDNIQTESTFCLILHSSENLRPTAKLKYTDTYGIEISIEMPVDLRIFKSYLSQGKHKGFGRYESYKVIDLVNGAEFTLTNYAGGHKYYTGTAEAFYKLLF